MLSLYSKTMHLCTFCIFQPRVHCFPDSCPCECSLIVIRCSLYSEADEWLKMRSVLRQLIMRPRDVAVFSDGVNEVVADLVVKVHKLRSQQPDGLTVLNVNDLFFKFAMEGVCVKVSEKLLCFMFYMFF